MNLREGLRMGALEIRTNKMRSFLSFLGVLFGVATVLLSEFSLTQGVAEVTRIVGTSDGAHLSWTAAKSASLASCPA